MIRKGDLVHCNSFGYGIVKKGTRTSNGDITIENPGYETEISVTVIRKIECQACEYCKCSEMVYKSFYCDYPSLENTLQLGVGVQPTGLYHSCPIKKYLTDK